MKKISVIVPVYKVEAYLERCVRSICRQSYTNLEIILVDDGSPDNSGKMCDELAQQDERIHVIHKKNGGLSDARNAGIERAAGEYIAFIDSDDWFDPTMLEVLYTLCEKNNAGIAECSYRSIYADHVQAETSCSGAIMEFTPMRAIESNLDWKYCKPVAWNKLYRRDVIGDTRYPVGKLHEDEFTTHLFYLAANKIMYVDIALMNYERRNLGSITASFRPKNLEVCEAFLSKANLIMEKPELKEIAPKACNNYCYILLDRIKQCEKEYPDCEELKNTIRDAYHNFEKLKKNGIEKYYVSELYTLFERYRSIL